MLIRKRATIEVHSNLELVLRERGKIKQRRKGHNIWLDLGCDYLAHLIAYSAFTPTLTPYRDDRIRYMGLGVGGTRQIAPAVANNPPISTAYPGTNLQTDTDPTVTRLERAVHVTAGIWLGQIQAPPVFPTGRSVTFSRLFTTLEVSYPPFLTVPLSEIALYTNAALPSVTLNTAVAYDTFDTLSKTDAFQLEVDWTIRF